MPNPFRHTRVLDAVGQSLGNPEPLLDRRQQQYPGVRGHLAAVESHMHRLALHRWQTRPNPRRSTLYEAFPAPEARRLLRRLEFHYVPKHASWLNMVEIEIGVLRGQC